MDTHDSAELFNVETYVQSLAHIAKHVAPPALATWPQTESLPVSSRDETVAAIFLINLYQALVVARERLGDKIIGYSNDIKAAMVAMRTQAGDPDAMAVQVLRLHEVFKIIGDPERITRATKADFSTSIIRIKENALSNSRLLERLLARTGLGNDTPMQPLDKLFAINVAEDPITDLLPESPDERGARITTLFRVVHAAQGGNTNCQERIAQVLPTLLKCQNCSRYFVASTGCVVCGVPQL